jgi:DNA mismatch repair protein MutL
VHSIEAGPGVIICDYGVGMTIRVLPDQIASAIAAGEVIERPASVVKELLENALDAGASRIEIRVEGGGRKLVEVGDDGCGIPADEIELAVARYATSKLERAEDLFAIQTLGFRGEALSSIAAASRLELTSRPQSAGQGMRLNVEAGRASRPLPVGAPQGTLVRIEDLFFNLPARQKFLKSENTERRRIQDLVTRYALAYPLIAFSLSQESRSALHTAGNGDRREVLASIFGLEAAKEMMQLPRTEHRGLVLEGFVSPPSIHRSNRRELTFFVNGRWVQDASLSAAVLQAYHGLLMVGRFPMAVILLSIPPQEVDVNVHPAKAEIRFREPGLVFGFVQRGVRAALLGQAPPPALSAMPGWQAAAGRQADLAWELARDLVPEVGVSGLAFLPSAAAPGSVPLLRAVGQVGAAYLVAEGPDGVYLIDQHAAHERVLFERLMAAQGAGTLESQALLAPVAVSLGGAQAALLEEQLPALQTLGFEVEPFGGGTFRVRSIPAILAGLAPEAALRSLVEAFEEDETPLQAAIESRIAARVCKRAAVKAGQVLSLQEQVQLIRDLEACQAPRTCPHGRPTMIHLSVEALERQFGRRG